MLNKLQIWGQLQRHFAAISSVFMAAVHSAEYFLPIKLGNFPPYCFSLQLIKNFLLVGNLTLFVESWKYLAKMLFFSTLSPWFCHHLTLSSWLLWNLDILKGAMKATTKSTFSMHQHQTDALTANLSSPGSPVQQQGPVPGGAWLQFTRRPRGLSSSWRWRQTGGGQWRRRRRIQTQASTSSTSTASAAR